MRQAAHAVRLILLDHLALGIGDEDERVGRRLERKGKACAKPFARALQIGERHPVILALHADIKLMRQGFGLLAAIGDLPLAARLQAEQERRFDGA